jgi:hypothetical protein
MARYIPKIPEDKRYSEKEMDEIRDKIRCFMEDKQKKSVESKVMFAASDLHGERTCEVVEFILDKRTQETINEIKTSGKLNSPFENYNSTEKWIKSYIDSSAVAESQAETLNKLMNMRILLLSDGKLNKKFDNEYFMSLDLEKIEGYRQHGINEHERKVDEFNRNNQLTPEQMNEKY